MICTTLKPQKLTEQWLWTTVALNQTMRRNFWLPLAVFSESHKFRRNNNQKTAVGKPIRLRCITFYFWYCCLQLHLFAAQLNSTTVFFFSVFIRHPSTKSECINMSVKISTHQLISITWSCNILSEYNSNLTFHVQSTSTVNISGRRV